MAVFTYKATTTSATEQSGTIAADTPRQARDLLRKRGLIVKDIAETNRKSETEAAPTEAVKPGQSARSVADSDSAPVKTSSRVFGVKPAGSKYQITLFIRELSTLLAVGIPLLEALDTIASQHTGRFNACILTLRDRVAAGASLAGTMRELPETFDDLCVNITEVGEDAGTLDSSLSTLADFRERSLQVKGRIGTILIYPAIVLVTAMLSSFFLMTFVVPKILEPLIEQGQQLPLPTRIVKSTSDFLLSYGWIGLIALPIVVSIFTMYLRTKKGRWNYDQFLLRIPVLGELIRKQAIVQISVIISTLLKSGIVFLRAMEIARRSTRNVVLQNALDQCIRAVTAGEDIAPAMAQSKAFPPMVMQIFALGQQSGQLEQMLDRLATNYDQQVQTSANRLTAILEPVLIIILAVVVLIIVMATVLPILEAGNAIQ